MSLEPLCTVTYSGVAGAIFTAVNGMATSDPLGCPFFPAMLIEVSVLIRGGSLSPHWADESASRFLTMPSGQPSNLQTAGTAVRAVVPQPRETLGTNIL